MNNATEYSGAPPPTRQELPQLKDRISFIYLEYCRLSREDSALKAEDKEGFVLIPSHAILTVILGPGCTLTHRAAELLSDSGTSIVWAGQGGQRFYGYGRSLARNANLLINQAKIVSNPKLHIEAVKKMYGMRFPDEDLTGLTLQQLRGKEGSRMKKVYREQSLKWSVPWSGRRYDVNDFSSGDPVNQALSVANTCLYGVVLAVVSGLGLSPGLGLIHTGLERSLIYDVADLYKAELTIPICFQLVSESEVGVEKRVRAALRNAIFSSNLVERMVIDLLSIFDLDHLSQDSEVLCLWDGKRGSVEAGIQYVPRKNPKEEQAE